MIYRTKINADIKINTLTDLYKLKPFLEDGTLKINRSQLARDLGKDRRTIEKYLNGYEKPTNRERSSYFDDYYSIISELLSDTNQQSALAIFFDFLIKTKNRYSFILVKKEAYTIYRSVEGAY